MAEAGEKLTREQCRRAGQARGVNEVVCRRGRQTSVKVFSNDMVDLEGLCGLRSQRRSAFEERVRFTVIARISWRQYSGEELKDAIRGAPAMS